MTRQPELRLAPRYRIGTLMLVIAVAALSVAVVVLTIRLRESKAREEAALAAIEAARRNLQHGPFPPLPAPPRTAPLPP